jgi:hypothetical protein
VCTTASIVQFLLTCSLVGFIGASFVLVGRVRAHLEEQHPDTWKWLGEWKIRWPDGEVQDAALPEYLWSGQYKSLNDPLLNSLVLRAKLTTAFSVAIALALVLQSVLYPSSRLFGCFHG